MRLALNTETVLLLFNFTYLLLTTLKRLRSSTINASRVWQIKSAHEILGRSKSFSFGDKDTKHLTCQSSEFKSLEYVFKILEHFNLSLLNYPTELFSFDLAPSG